MGAGFSTGMCKKQRPIYYSLAKGFAIDHGRCDEIGTVSQPKA